MYNSLIYTAILGFSYVFGILLDVVNKECTSPEVRELVNIQFLSIIMVSAFHILNAKRGKSDE